MLTQREISDRLEIEQLLYRYGRAVDARELERLRSVFTADARIAYNVVRGVDLRFPEMLEWLGRSLRIFKVTQHAMSNPMIELEGDTARATTYLSAAHVQQRLDGEETYVLQHAIYFDALVRTDAGWRISSRRLDNIWIEGSFLGPDEVRCFEKPEPQGRPEEL